MRHMTWLSVLLAAFALLGGSESEAGLFCGMGRYRHCPSESCEPCQDYCQARTCNSGCYKTVRETVWCTEQYQECQTVMDTCVEKVPVQCNRTVHDTCWRDECYTVCKPCYQTCYRQVCYTVRKPCYQTCYRTVCCQVRKPCYQTCYRNVCYTVCKPCYQTCYRTVCHQVRKPHYQTCYRDVCCTGYHTQTQTCYKDVCHTVCRPITETRCENVCGGEWQIVKECVPGPVVDRCVTDPGSFCFDENSCCCVYKPGCCRTEKVQCPPRVCCKKVWVPKTYTRNVCCTRWVSEVKHCQVPCTTCCRVPYSYTKQVPYTTCSWTCETCSKQVPYTTCSYTRECRTKQVPYTTCTWTCETVSRQVPYTTCSYTCEQRTKQVPYTTCTMTQQVCHRQVPYTTCRQVCETRYVTKTRCVPRQITVCKTRCVPKIVCRQVPVDPGCDAGGSCLSVNPGCAAPMTAGCDGGTCTK